jgi:hypothetical protein
MTAMRRETGGQWQRLVHLAGVAIAVAALAFVVAALVRQWSALGGHWPVAADPTWLFASFAAWLGCLLPMSMAWPLVLNGLSRPLALAHAIPIGLAAQLGKYLPGNVAHYLGRAVIGKRHGVALADSGVATVIELAAAALAAAVTVALVLLADPAAVAMLPAAVATAGRGGVLVAIGIGALGLGGLVVVARHAALGIVGVARLITPPVLVLLAAFALAGMSFHAVARALDAGNMGIMLAAGIFALAWLAGFLVPGAPAGIGVREAVLLVLLGRAGVAAPDALVLVLVHRLIATAADALAALAAGAWLARVRARA